MPVAKVGAEQNVSTGYARRRRRDTAMDGGSIPPISTNPPSREWAREPRNHAVLEPILLVMVGHAKLHRPQIAHEFSAHKRGKLRLDAVQ